MVRQKSFLEIPYPRNGIINFLLLAYRLINHIFQNAGVGRRLADVTIRRLMTRRLTRGFYTALLLVGLIRLRTIFEMIEKIMLQMKLLWTITVVFNHFLLQ